AVENAPKATLAAKLNFRNFILISLIEFRNYNLILNQKRKNLKRMFLFSLLIIHQITSTLTLG
ncbi:hypothetical protein, partial [Helicobacter sp. UBA3407]|uniref:hypothetical protein n=1 Tax=Helicobacter sp. UBA3407 TaxID=1946588 RepID=UPI00261285B5